MATISTCILFKRDSQRPSWGWPFILPKQLIQPCHPQHALPSQYLVTWTFCVWGTSDRRPGRSLEARQTGRIAQNPPTQLGPRAEKISGRYGPIPCTLRAPHPESVWGTRQSHTSGWPEPATQCKLGRLSLVLWCTFGAIVQQKAPISCQLRRNTRLEVFDITGRSS